MKKNKSQSVLEYAVLIACIVAALIAMQIFLKRSVQGKLKTSAESIGGQYSATNTRGTTTISKSSHSITVTTVNDDDDRVTTDTETSLLEEHETTDSSLTVDPIASERLF